MKRISIFADSCCSLSKEEANKLGVIVIPTLFRIENEDYNPLEDNILSYDEFYNKLQKRCFCKTSCINPNTFIEYFSKELEKGNDIIYISLSSGLSSSYNNANLAKSILEEDYNNTIEIIDSMTGSLGIQIIINKACEFRDRGLSAEEISERLDKNKLNITSLFTIGDLEHLRRGGRISTIKALIGRLVKIHPIITTDNEGKLILSESHRGKISTINKMIDSVKNNMLLSETLYIAYTNNLEEAEYIKDTLKEYVKNINLGRIDYTMGAHCGHGTLALFYINKEM